MLSVAWHTTSGCCFGQSRTEIFQNLLFKKKKRVALDDLYVEHFRWCTCQNVAKSSFRMVFCCCLNSVLHWEMCFCRTVSWSLSVNSTYIIHDAFALRSSYPYNGHNCNACYQKEWHNANDTWMVQICADETIVWKNRTS